MGYTSDGSLADLFKPTTAERAGRRITERVGDELLDRTKKYTPVAKPPIPFRARTGRLTDMEMWLRARGGRTPGTLRASWRVSDVEHWGVSIPMGAMSSRHVRDDFEVEVYTLDPVAPHVEYPTEPHLIVPKDPDGWLRWWEESGRIRFAKVVSHPGTQGSFMLQRALGDIRVEWRLIAAEEIAVWAATYWRS